MTEAVPPLVLVDGTGIVIASSCPGSLTAAAAVTGSTTAAAAVAAAAAVTAAHCSSPSRFFSMFLLELLVSSS